MTLLIVSAAKYLYLLVVALGLAVWLTRARAAKLVLGLTTAVAGVVGLLLIVLASNLYVDQRPFVTHHIEPMIPHAADNGFPSDHTTLSMVVALSVLTVSWRWGGVAVLAALGVGGARIAAGVHSPVDIAGAIVIALLAVAVGRGVAGWLREPLDRRLPGRAEARLERGA